MTANKMSAGLFDNWLEIVCHCGLDAANVGNDCVLLDSRRKLLRQSFHLAERSAEDNQISAGDSFEQITRRRINSPGATTFIDACLPANVADDRFRQRAPAQGFPKRPAKESHPN